MIYNKLEFKPKEYEIYYYINFNNNEVGVGIYVETYSTEDVLDRINCATNNCFKTIELAQEYLDMHNDLNELLEKYPVNWNDGYEAKYHSSFEHSFKYFDVDRLFVTQYQGGIYVSNRAALEYFIDKHKKAIKKFIFCVEEEKEELYYIKFPMFKNGENYLNVNLNSNNWFLDDVEEFANDNKTKWTKEECDKIIKDNSLQNFVELERVE